MADTKERNPLAGLNPDEQKEARKNAEERLEKRPSEASDRDDVLTGWSAQQGAATAGRVNPVYAEDPVRFSAEELPPPEAARHANIAPQRIPEDQIADEGYDERYQENRPPLQGGIRKSEARKAAAAAEERGTTLEDRNVIGPDADDDDSLSDVEGGDEVTDDGGSSDDQGDGPTQGGPGDAEAPNKSANKDAWVDYAVSQGADREEAEDSTKEDLVNQYG